MGFGVGGSRRESWVWKSVSYRVIVRRSVFEVFFFVFMRRF